MAELAGPLAAVATVLQVAGHVSQGKAAASMGEAQQRGLESQAVQLRQRAGQERAASQRQAIEQRRQGRLAQSRALALAAASGGGTDGSAEKIIADLAGEGELRALTALYQGEEAATGLEFGADMKVFEGSEAARAGKIRKQAAYGKAITTALSGGSSMFEKYWPQGDDISDGAPRGGMSPGGY